MQLQGIRVVIISFFIINYAVAQQNIYRLKTVDSTSFLKYYYFEFKKDKKKYIVISQKSHTNSLANLCLLNLEIKKYYNLNLERLFFLEDKDDNLGVFFYDVERMIFKGGKRKFGGLERPVYMCNAIFKNQISCECLVDRKKR